MHIISLDKKLWTVQSRHDVTHLDNIGVKHNLSKEQVQGEIQKDLYQKMMVELQKAFQVMMTVLPSGEEQYEVSGYCLTKLNMFELIQELLEMDEVGKQKLLEDVTKAITYRDKNVK